MNNIAAQIGEILRTSVLQPKFTGSYKKITITITITLSFRTP